MMWLVSFFLLSTGIFAVSVCICTYAVRNAVASRGSPAVLAAGGKWAVAHGRSFEDLQLLVMVDAHVKKEE